MSRRYVIHKGRDLECMRDAARAAAEALDSICRSVRPGMTTLELDSIAKRCIDQTGGSSAFHRLYNFPGQVCISINDEVVHGYGRPDRVIQYGDIVSIDCGVNLKGFMGDNARTVSVGPAMGQTANLLTVTQSGLAAGIEAATAGNTVWHIGTAVERTIKAAGYGIVREFVGHGIGKQVHLPPEVPNYARNESKQDKLRPGMIIAIEPMVNIGTAKVRKDADKWTIRTADGTLSAHFEHMVLITENEPEILTWLKKT